MLRVDDACRARVNGGYEEVVLVKMNKKTARVRLANGRDAVLPLGLLKMKKKGTRAPKTFAKQNDHKLLTRRLGRYRRPIEVIPVRFSPSRAFGDYGAMLKISAYRDNGVFLFNDNLTQWIWHGLHPDLPQGAGGGNAIARPAQHLGHAIGMPTGPFSSLSDRRAKEIIDEATNRVVRLFLDNPAKEILYFCVNPSDPPESTRIGLAIFAGAVGEDVIEYISQKIQTIPRLIMRARQGADGGVA